MKAWMEARARVAALAGAARTLAIDAPIVRDVETLPGLVCESGCEAPGVCPQAGYELGAWHDGGWWRLVPGPTDDAPAAPVPCPAIRDSAACERAATSGLAGLRL